MPKLSDLPVISYEEAQALTDFFSTKQTYVRPLDRTVYVEEQREAISEKLKTAPYYRKKGETEIGIWRLPDLEDILSFAIYEIDGEDQEFFEGDDSDEERFQDWIETFEKEIA